MKNEMDLGCTMYLLGKRAHREENFQTAAQTNRMQGHGLSPTFNWLRTRFSGGSCEHGNEYSGTHLHTFNYLNLVKLYTLDI
jgi:hypothetical protein